MYNPGMIATEILAMSLRFRDAGMPKDAAVRLAFSYHTAFMATDFRAKLADILGIPC